MTFEGDGLLKEARAQANARASREGGPMLIYQYARHVEGRAKESRVLAVRSLEESAPDDPNLIGEPALIELVGVTAKRAGKKDR